MRNLTSDFWIPSTNAPMLYLHTVRMSVYDILILPLPHSMLLILNVSKSSCRPTLREARETVKVSQQMCLGV